MSIWALYSMKGGVGKTAAAVNLAYEAVQSGATALLCDLDPQGAAAFYFRIRAKKKFGRKRFLKGGKHVTQNIRGTDFEGLDLLPSAMSFRNLDLGLDDRAKNKNHLKRLLAPMRKDYDHIFLDCPPNLTLLARARFQSGRLCGRTVYSHDLVDVDPSKIAGFFFKKPIEAREIGRRFFQWLNSAKPCTAR